MRITAPIQTVIRYFSIIFPSSKKIKTLRGTALKRIPHNNHNLDDLSIDRSEINQKYTPSGCENFAYHAFSSHTVSATSTYGFAGSKRTSGRQKYSGRKGQDEAKFRIRFHRNDKFRAPFSAQVEIGGKPIIDDKKTIEEHIFDFLLEPTPNENNRCGIICGDIGCGKSTLVTTVVEKLDVYREKIMRTRDAGKKPLEVAIIDFERLIPKGDTVPANISEYVASEIIDKEIAAQVKAQCCCSGTGMKNVCNHVLREAKLVIIFDNLDSIYHHVCTRIFGFAGGYENSIEVRRYYPFIYELFENFISRNFNQLGIDCIFVGRTDTISLIRGGLGHDDGQLSMLDSVDMVVKLQSPDGMFLRDVILGRMSLAESFSKGRCSNSIYKRNLEMLSKESDRLDEISKLSVQGLRHTVAIYRRLSWSCFNEAFSRFFINIDATHIFHYLGGKTNFTPNSTIKCNAAYAHLIRSTPCPNTVAGAR